MTRPWFLWAAAFALLVAAIVASLLAGRVWLSPGEVVEAFRTPGTQLADLIVLELRAPRTVLAILVGAALGTSGAALQGLLRNPLAEPGLLGVSGGAALGAVIAIYFGLANATALAAPLCGLAGALGAGALTFALGRRGGVLALILAGVAVSALMGAGVALALNFAPNLFAVFEITVWLMGSLADRSWDHVVLAGPFIVAGLAMLLATRRALDALALGEVQAASLGVDLGRTQALVLVGTALAVGAAVAVAGAVGFIGLVAPHLVRPFVGHQPSRVLAPSAAAGAALLLAADVATRMIRTTSDIRLGVLTSLIGLPFFFWLVLKLKRTAP